MPAKPKPIKLRLFAKLSMPGPDECWEYQGATSQGYGYMRYKKINEKWTMKRTHVVSYEIHNGDIPKGFCVLHSCDNRLCCNPKHLWIGTKKDNAVDMSKKNRWRNQYRSGGYFTPILANKAIEMRNSGFTVREIAKHTGISTCALYKRVFNKPQNTSLPVSTR